MDFNEAILVLELVYRTFTMNELKKAYYKAALKHHPDRDSGNTEQFQRIGEAYNFLSAFLKAQKESDVDADVDVDVNTDEYDNIFSFKSKGNQLIFSG